MTTMPNKKRNVDNLERSGGLGIYEIYAHTTHHHHRSSIDGCICHRLLMEAQQHRTPEEAEEMKLNLERLIYPRNWMLAILLYAHDHDMRVPTAFADALPYFPPPQGDEIVGLTADDLEIVYAGTIDAIQEPARTIVLREREPRLALNGNWTRAYAFAEGHTEIRSQQTDDFTTWESERLLSSSPTLDQVR